MYYQCSRQICRSVTAQLICAFVFAYACCWFLYAAANICLNLATAYATIIYIPGSTKAGDSGGRHSGAKMS